MSKAQKNRIPPFQDNRQDRMKMRLGEIGPTFADDEYDQYDQYPSRAHIPWSV